MKIDWDLFWPAQGFVASLCGCAVQIWAPGGEHVFAVMFVLFAAINGVCFRIVLSRRRRQRSEERYFR